MKKWVKFEFAVIFFAAMIGIMDSCKEKSVDTGQEIALNNEKEPGTQPKKRALSKEFKEYWYAGDAEVTSYQLEQARYGEIRNGSAVLIYVTEPFVAEKQVKADNSSPDNVSVLKLNRTKKYLTGIYPYSIMGSSFYPVHDNGHALKLTFSAQEWCGQVFSQLNNREKYEVRSFSYFESEGDKTLELDKNVLESELWNKIRINPNDLPTGELLMIPSFEYLRMGHTELKAYKAKASISRANGLKTYKIEYPELDRVLEINFTEGFPYTIEGWSDTFESGFGANRKQMATKAKKLKTLKTPYWKQNSNAYLPLRDTLGI